MFQSSPGSRPDLIPPGTGDLTVSSAIAIPDAIAKIQPRGVPSFTIITTKAVVHLAREVQIPPALRLWLGRAEDVLDHGIALLFCRPFMSHIDRPDVPGIQSMDLLPRYFASCDGRRPIRHRDGRRNRINHV